MERLELLERSAVREPHGPDAFGKLSVILSPSMGEEDRRAAAGIWNHWNDWNGWNYWNGSFFGDRDLICQGWIVIKGRLSEEPIEVK